MATTIKTVSDAIQAAGITPDASYSGEEMTDDFILGIKTDETAATELDYTVCMDHIKKHSGGLNPTTASSTYIRTGPSTSKTSVQRQLSIEGDRRPGDAFQDYVLGHEMVYATGESAKVAYVYFSLRTGKGETGTAMLSVSEDVGGEAGNKATFSATLYSDGVPDAYTYTAASEG